MSRGKKLQEMEVGTKQSRTAVNANAASAEAMPHLQHSTPGQTGEWEDLGGPSPENYSPTDDSAALRVPGKTLKQVADVVTNRKGKLAAMSMASLQGSAPGQKGMGEEVEDEEYDEDDELYEAADEEDDDEEESGKKRGHRKSKKEGDDDEEDDGDKEDDDGEDDEMDESFDIEDDVNALFEGEELSEDFQYKAKTIFEAALRSKAVQIRETLEEQYEQALLEEVEQIKADLQERVDAYLEYVSDEWLKENALVVEQGLKSEISESFLAGMKNLFEEHYVSIPEDKYDVFESMVEKLDEMETKLNEQIDKNVSLNKRLSEAVADGIFEHVSSGLADTQRDKLASLAEGVEFESEGKYREKLETLRESYFPTRLITPPARTETLSESVDTAHETHSDSMSAYLKALSAFSK